MNKNIDLGHRKTTHDVYGNGQCCFIVTRGHKVPKGQKIILSSSVNSVTVAVNEQSKMLANTELNISGQNITRFALDQCGMRNPLSDFGSMGDSWMKPRVRHPLDYHSGNHNSNI